MGLGYQWARQTRRGSWAEGGYSLLRRWFGRLFLGEKFIRIRWKDDG
jgi:hypothetical protein